MSSVTKFTNSAMCDQIRHNCREISNSRNKEIDPDRSHLNYKFQMSHGNVSDYKYYKDLLDRTYLYGMGTSREEKAVTGCGWVVTLPHEIYGDPEKEKAFFSGAYQFISDRYGAENIINNAVHYDEEGLPHLHVIFCPVTDLDHDIIHYKTHRTKQAVKLDSGRYEYTYEFKLDENGNRIHINNYSRMSDYYDTKVDANTVMNPIELRHFHSDLQQYLNDHGIEGHVITGQTGGINYSVDSLKQFTQKTGLHLADVKEIQAGKSVLETVVESKTEVDQLRQIITEKDELIEALQKELTVTKEHVAELEKQHQTPHVWGQHEQSPWGKNIEWEIEN